MTENTLNTVKYRIRRIAVPILCGILMSGCSEKITPDPHDLTIDYERNSGAGIGIGATYDEWAEVFGDSYIQKVSGEGILTPYTIQEATDKDGNPVDRDGTYMISGFYVDNEPVSVKSMEETYGFSAAEMSDHLTDPAFLEEHTVIFRYISFTITDDIVTEVSGDYLDYNEEL